MAARKPKTQSIEDFQAGQRLRVDEEERLPGEGMGSTPAEREIVPLALEYARKRDARMALLLEEKAAKTMLLEACQENGVREMTMPDGRVISVTDKWNVKVRRPSSEDDDGQPSLRMDKDDDDGGDDD